MTAFTDILILQKYFARRKMYYPISVLFLNKYMNLHVHNGTGFNLKAIEILQQGSRNTGARVGSSPPPPPLLSPIMFIFICLRIFPNLGRVTKLSAS